jgi:hypothetical protein
MKSCSPDGAIPQMLSGENDLERRNTMGSRIDNTTGPQDNFSASETTNEKQLDRIADEVAKRAEGAEHRYDQDHDIFTK